MIVDAVRRTLDRPRVIVMFRDPVTRLWSQFRFMKAVSPTFPRG